MTRGPVPRAWVRALCSQWACRGSALGPARRLGGPRGSQTPSLRTHRCHDVSLGTGPFSCFLRLFAVQLSEPSARFARFAPFCSFFPSFPFYPLPFDFVFIFPHSVSF